MRSVVRWVHANWRLASLVVAVVVLSYLVPSYVPSVPTDTRTLSIGKTNTVLASGTLDYTCDGSDDHVQFLALLTALPANGGRVEVYGGTYSFGQAVSRAIDNVEWVGMGGNPTITRDGVNPCVDVGSQDGWTFSGISFDAGGVDTSSATHCLFANVTVGSTYCAYWSSEDVSASSWRLPTGRSAQYVIAAYSANETEKAQADVTCDGSGSDEDVIQAALAAGYKNIRLVGDFATDGRFDVTGDYVTIWSDLGSRIRCVSTDGMYVSGDSFTLKNVKLQGNWGNTCHAGEVTLELNNAHDFHIENSIIWGGEQGVAAINTTHGVLLNVRTAYSQQEGLRLVGTSENITCIYSYGCTFGGWYQNVSGDNGRAVYTKNCQQTYFLGGWIYNQMSGGTGDYAMFMDEGTAFCTVDGVYFGGHDVAAIALQGTSGNIVKGNSVLRSKIGTAQYGLHLVSYAVGNVFESNEFNEHNYAVYAENSVGNTGNYYKQNSIFALNNALIGGSLGAVIVMPECATNTLSLADHSYSEATELVTAGENLTFGQLCYLESDGKVYKAKADSGSTVPATYMVTGSILADNQFYAMSSGEVRDDSWNWAPGGLLYTDNVTAGGLTQTAPASTGDQVQICGIALSADVIKLNFNLKVDEVP